jgi:hypothetical protein
MHFKGLFKGLLRAFKRLSKAFKRLAFCLGVWWLPGLLLAPPWKPLGLRNKQIIMCLIMKAFKGLFFHREKLFSLFL